MGLLWILQGFTTCLLVYCIQNVASRDVTVTIGQTATLPCSVGILGSYTVIWKFSDSDTPITVGTNRVINDDRFSVDRPYVKEWNLKIVGVKRTDQREYQCVVNSTPVQTTVVNLIVNYPPTITDSSADTSVDEGRSASLMCRASGAPNPSISWYHYQDGQRKLVKQSSTTFEISDANKEQGGTYECVASNGVSPTDKKMIQFDVNFKPVMTLPYQRISQQEGKDSLLECVVTAHPPPEVYWEKTGRRLEESEKYKIHKWEVGEYTKSLGAFIFYLDQNDFGEYTCVAENSLGKIQKSLNLYEYNTGQIRVIATPKHTAATVGTDAFFDCTVEGLTHRDSLTWWRNSPETGLHKIFHSNPASQSAGGNVIHMDDTKYEIRGHYNLRIINVTEEDAGEYMCQIAMIKNHTAELTVSDNLKCVTNGTNLDVGELVHLTCAMNFSGPALNWEVEWIHGDRKLSSVKLDSEGSMYRMVKFPAVVQDSGNYVCEVSSRQPAFAASCSTELSVKQVVVTPQPVCGKMGQIDLGVMGLIVAASLVAVIVVFICIILLILSKHKKAIEKYRQVSGSLYRSQQYRTPPNLVAHNRVEGIPSFPTKMWLTPTLPPVSLGTAPDYDKGQSDVLGKETSPNKSFNRSHGSNGKLHQETEMDALTLQDENEHEAEA